MEIKKLDELQYIQRGNIFKHCLLTIIGLLLVYITMLQLDIVFMSHRNALALITLFIVSLFCIEMICYDIYPLSEKRQKYLYFFAGFVGLAAIAATIYDLICGEARLIENGMLSDASAGIILGCLFLTIFFAYIIKKIHTKNKREVDAI